jgi:hypothetical protein
VSQLSKSNGFASGRRDEAGLQQEFLKTGIKECSALWDEILSKAEAFLEQAELAMVKLTSTKGNKTRA